MNVLWKIVVITCLLTILASSTAGQRCNGGVECVLINECTGLYNQLRNGATPQLTSLLRSLHCGFYKEMPMSINKGNANNKKPSVQRVRRKKPRKNHKQKIVTQTTQRPIVRTTTKRPKPAKNKICCPPQFREDITPNTNDRYTTPASTNRNRASLLPGRDVCGIQNDERIVGGSRTEIDEHPWMALIRYDKPYGHGFYCGGVLISSRYVMTAAHCVKGEDLPSNWRLSQVRLGEWNTSSEYDCLADDCAGPVQDVDVEETIAHDNYDPKDANQHNDIALLRLAKPVQFTDFIKPICLPTTRDLRNQGFDGYTMEVAGWGKTETRSDSDVKLKVQVPVVSTSDCASTFGRVSREIINTQLCAGGNSGQDSCRGDSGGALMGRVPTVNNWFAFGVVSYGPSPCGTPGWPGVYTRVGAYVDWIQSKIRP